MLRNPTSPISSEANVGVDMIDTGRFADEMASCLTQEQLDHSGRILYTGRALLVPSDVYIVGKNPGGWTSRPDTEDATVCTIREDLRRWAEERPGDYCAPRADGTWKDSLVKGYEAVLRFVGADPWKVVSSNVIFGRGESRKTALPRRSKTSWFRECMAVHRLLLGIVQPRRIVIYGNQKHNTADWFADALGAKEIPEAHAESGWTRYSLRAWEGKLEGRTVRLLGFPHFSYYTAFDAKRREHWEPWLQEWW